MKKAIALTLTIPLLLAACATTPPVRGYGRVGDHMETLKPIATPAPHVELLAGTVQE